MDYLTTEQRESLEATMKARAEELRDAIAATLSHGQDRTRGLSNRYENTKVQAVVDLANTLDVAALQRYASELREVETVLKRLRSPNKGSAQTAVRH